jgi:hypothetical protein
LEWLPPDSLAIITSTFIYTIMDNKKCALHNKLVKYDILHGTIFI